MQVFAGHAGPVNCGEFTPDGWNFFYYEVSYASTSALGKRIVTADQEGYLIFWDPRSSVPIFKLGPEDARFSLDGITSIAVNPSSTLAVVGGAAGGVRVVSLSKGEIISTLGGHTEGESIEAIVFIDVTGAGGSGPGVAVTGATDGKACVWDLGTMRLRSTLQHQVWNTPSSLWEISLNLVSYRTP
jgi:ribosome assembly protein SQT1